MTLRAAPSAGSARTTASRAVSTVFGGSVSSPPFWQPAARRPRRAARRRPRPRGPAPVAGAARPVVAPPCPSSPPWSPSPSRPVGASRDLPSSAADALLCRHYAGGGDDGRRVAGDDGPQPRAARRAAARAPGARTREPVRRWRRTSRHVIHAFTDPPAGDPDAVSRRRRPVRRRRRGPRTR